MTFIPLSLFLSLFLGLIFTQDQSDLRGQVLPTVRHIFDRVRNTRSLSYAVNYVSIEPGATDSVHKSSGAVWLQRLPQDSIFGCRLHVRGSDNLGDFDYYYDGQDSYELRHKGRTLTLFHPHLYPNSANNPAKARTALSLFFPLLVDTDVVHTLLSDVVDSSLTVDNEVGTLIFKYRPTQHGQLVTQKLRFRADDFSVISNETDVTWQGLFVKYLVTLHDSRWNAAITNDDIAFAKMPSNYKLVELNYDQGRDSKLGSRLLRAQAPNFSYPDLSGKRTSLTQFHGKVVLLDFWETWCGHCIASIPRINSLQRDYEHKGLNVLGITTENPTLVRELVTLNNLTYTTLLADTLVLRDYQISGRPTYILIDQFGRISAVSYGDLDFIEAGIRMLAQ